MITLANCLSTISSVRLNEPIPTRLSIGIVIVAGRSLYLSYAYSTIRRIRDLGCTLPIQLWHIGEHELSGNSREIFSPYGVEFVDVEKVNAETGDLTTLGGWQVKSMAIKRCPFRHVLLLDADSVPLINPESLFDSEQYRESGAIFWPDAPNPEYPSIPQCFGIEGYSPIEAGQLMVDKVRHWRGVQLVTWLNSQSDFFYSILYGDKDLWGLGFQFLGIPYTTPPSCAVRSYGLEHHWFDGAVAFTHLIFSKRHRLIPVPQETDRYLQEYAQLLGA